MKISKIVLVVIVIILLANFVACSPNEYTSEVFHTEVSIPFEDVDENTEILIEYGHSPYNFPENYTFYYDGGILVIPYAFYGGRVDSEIGFFVFIDGMVQPFSVSPSDESTACFMHVFNIEAREPVKISDRKLR